MATPDQAESGSLNCEEVASRLDDYLDRELVADELRLVAEHLAACAACAEEHRFEAGVLESLKAKIRQLSVPADLKDRVLSRLRRLS